MNTYQFPWHLNLFGWRVYLEFKLQDLWIGLYWDHKNDGYSDRLNVWVCLIPCVPIHFVRHRIDSSKMQDWQAKMVYGQCGADLTNPDQKVYRPTWPSME